MTIDFLGGPRWYAGLTPHPSPVVVPKADLEERSASGGPGPHVVFR